MNHVKLQLLASRVLSLANTIPKDENRIVFYSTPDVSDNALALFKYVYNINDGYTLVWLLNSPDSRVVPALREKYPEVRTVPLYSARGLKELVRAKFVVTTDVLPVTPHFGQRVIQLWHGLPGKKTGHEHPLGIKDLYLYMDRWTTDFVTTSELVVGAFVRQFMINPRKFRILGQPRNDGIFTNLRLSRELLSGILNIDVEGYDHVLFYAPTYRYTSYLKDFEASVGVVKSLLNKRFTEFLQRINALLVIKPHKLVADAVAPEIENSGNIRLLTDEPLVERFLTINDVMGAFDVLITDYSSIYEDYLLLERPVVFYLPDRVELERKSGFLLPYEFFAPGAKPEDVEGLINALAGYIDDPSLDSEWRKTVKNLLYEVGSDDKSSERVYKRLIREE
ncbi:CDP-glycerol glycerophosphotransferase family protein [Thermococcus waiotapuensis]|uniref:CDP-glycerol glycerophosphotransferase family protein n=1 Tax=Thermococcus waiotapuensis TaxID=90909 RepID=A0AAE4NYN7_9EURY|nr:CDP-glycerol glycerophosphotransferase family protein [Thermococcus waiotapuensis]MDV3104731.1 CDP-glycerol glycerophosphotransferase family protein [Thermococcus waiotapuensis]